MTADELLHNILIHIFANEDKICNNCVFSKKKKKTIYRQEYAIFFN